MRVFARKILAVNKAFDNPRSALAKNGNVRRFDLSRLNIQVVNQSFDKPHLSPLPSKTTVEIPCQVDKKGLVVEYELKDQFLPVSESAGREIS